MPRSATVRPNLCSNACCLACGAATLRGDEEHYLQLLELYFQQCGVELLIVDEVEHITQPGLRRRFLELIQPDWRADCVCLLQSHRLGGRGCRDPGAVE